MALPVPPPPIETRSGRDFAEETERLLEGYTGWRPPVGDPAWALVRVFARMAEVVADRVNRTPEKHFLAFLDLLGVQPHPPVPARVPLTFSLAAGSATDAVVPARTPVAAAPLEGEKEPVVFETERELVVTRSVLAHARVRDPGQDRWADRSAQAAAREAFLAFQGDTPAEHRLCVGHAEAFGADGPKTLVVRLGDEHGPRPAWLRLLEWSVRDAAGWRRLPWRPGATGPADVVLPGAPGVPVTLLEGRASAWLSARLTVPLRRREVAPRALFRGGERLHPEDGPVYPFGREALETRFYLSAPAVFSVPGARARLRVVLDGAAPAPRPDGGLVVAWEYAADLGGRVAWRPLGRATPGEDAHGTVEPGFADGTRGLTRDGALAFTVPADWARTHQAGPTGRLGKSGMWLRARVEAGGFGEALDFGPPAVARLGLDYDLELPPVTALKAQLRVHRAGQVPPAGFFNATALDLSKDFLPFGDKPRRGDTLYLALPGLVGKPGAEASLTFTVNPQAAPADEGWAPPYLRWEYWNRLAGGWALLGESGTRTAESALVGAREMGGGGTVAPTKPRAPARETGFGLVDGTHAFTAAGPQAVTFRVPPDLGRVEVNGRGEAWVRVRIAGGGYGRDVQYVATQVSTGDGRTQTAYIPVPPTYRPPSVHSAALEYRYASRFTDPDAVLALNDFAVAEPARAGTAVTPFTPFVPPADERPALYLGFERPGDAAGFGNRTVALYFGVAPVLFGDPPDPWAGDEPPALAWSYWDGAGWARLGVRDETAAFTRRGMVTFVGPDDFRASTQLGRTAFWLRARLERGGYPHPPRLERVLTNTVWAEHANTVANEVLGSGSGRPGQAFRTARAPVLPGERVEVREPELPSAEERVILRDEAGDDGLTRADPAGATTEVWVRWTAVPDFHGSGPRSRHYVVDRVTGEVRFGDGTQGMAPPQARAGVRALRYRTGGGPQGNRPVGNLAQLKAAVAFVDRVTNLEPAAGGAGAEPVEALKLRGPTLLRHRGRAVTVADLEDLAREASPEVATARAVAPADEHETGRVRVIVVPHAAAAAQPVPSMELLDDVDAFLRARLPVTVELEVLGPEWVRVEVDAEVVPDSYEAAGEVAGAVSAAFAAFLHPLTGGPDGQGWPFGRRPYRSDLYAVAEAVPGVDHVRRLAVAESGPPRSAVSLVYSGTHRVSVAGSTEA